MDCMDFFRIHQRFPPEHIADIPAAVRQSLNASGVRIARNANVAIAVGSRGISGLRQVVTETVGWVRAQGGSPFIVPAMGSHGGATAEGQVAVLEGYGITEDEVGAPIRSSMEVVSLPQGESPVAVFLDRMAAGADAIIVINRIKPHTSFHGRYESGLMKMLAIGLGKHRQALAIHAMGLEGLRNVMPVVAGQILRHAGVLLGIAVVENAYDEPLHVRAIPAALIPREEPALLELARRNMPRLPLEKIDVLVVDEMGKNISGLGMDTNVIGRLKVRGQPEPESPEIRMIIARDLTEETRGNAAGIGLADVITRRLFSRIDFRATYENVLTTGFLERARIPIIAESDRAALEIAFREAGMPAPEQARVIRIRNTLRLGEMLVSKAAWEAMAGCSDVELAGTVPALFDVDGNMMPF